MTQLQLDALKAWVRAEIEYAIACNAEDGEGYKVSARHERDEAQRLESELSLVVLGVNDRP